MNILVVAATWFGGDPRPWRGGIKTVKRLVFSFGGAVMASGLEQNHPDGAVRVYETTHAHTPHVDTQGGVGGAGAASLMCASSSPAGGRWVHRGNAEQTAPRVHHTSIYGDAARPRATSDAGTKTGSQTLSSLNILNLNSRLQIF